MSEADALRIEWPSSFFVRYVDGKTEHLLAPDGVAIMLRSDCPEGRGSLSAQIEPKHPRHRSPGYRCVFFDEIESITSDEGAVLWPRPP